LPPADVFTNTEASQHGMRRCSARLLSSRKANHSAFGQVEGLDGLAIWSEAAQWHVMNYPGTKRDGKLCQD
jgi:hypothetical protein